LVREPLKGNSLVKDTDPIHPTKLRIEATTACQLACPTCPTAEGKVDASLGRGFLRAENFRRLLDQGKGVLKSIELSNFGEPFLNPELLEIFRIAHVRRRLSRWVATEDAVTDPVAPSSQDDASQIGK
jgi:MoaA/NifB/PqqE/SkfB family radical SAM enzyme